MSISVIEGVSVFLFNPIQNFEKFHLFYFYSLFCWYTIQLSPEVEVTSVGYLPSRKAVR